MPVGDVAQFVKSWTLSCGVCGLSYLHVYPLPCLRLILSKIHGICGYQSETDWHTFWSIQSFRMPHQVCEFSFLTWRPRMLYASRLCIHSLFFVTYSCLILYQECPIFGEWARQKHNIAFYRVSFIITNCA